MVVTTPTQSGFRDLFDHERLVVYGVAREVYVMFKVWKDRAMPREVRDQVRRSLLSILSNIAEGAGKTSKPDKRRFYEIAKGSTTESAAQLEILHLLDVISATEYQAAREKLVRVAKMLQGLCGHRRSST